jgi:hypothetical protein
MIDSNSSLGEPAEDNGAREHGFSRKLFFTSGSSLAVSSLFLTACGQKSDPVPLSKLKTVKDTPQPHPATASREASPDQWVEASHQGISFYLPNSFQGPQQRSEWGMYEVSYDLIGDQSYTVQRVMCSGVSKNATNPNGVRQSVKFINKGIIENYQEVKRISWDADKNNAIERIFFYWGTDSAYPGWTWMIASSSGVGVLTLFGAYSDDGLRNGIETSLTLKGA